MNIKRVKIKNFRNLRNVDYEPCSGLNIILGKNAQGKTSILEAIYVLATGNTFRKTLDINLINYEKDFFSIQADYSIGESTFESRLDYNKDGIKNLRVNNKKSQFKNQDRLKMVLFTPDDLFLVKGSPGRRRAFLDFCLRQISTEYNYNLDDFALILRKRNLFLKNEQTKSKSFKIINDVYVEKASSVIFQRLNFVILLDELGSKIYKQINDGQDELKIRYALSFNIDSSERINLEVIQRALHKQINNEYMAETKRKTTLVGPHLEDLNFYLDAKMARIFASQGQQRNIAISLKIAELYTYQKIRGVSPIVLLDEVLSELDESKRKYLLSFLQKGAFQTFLTSVDIDMSEHRRECIQVIENGELWRKG